MKKFLKKHYGAILFIVPILFMALNFYFSPYRVREKGDLTRGFLFLLSITPSTLLMGWFICWEVKRALGEKYSMTKTFKEYNGFILFATLCFWLVFSLIFTPDKPRLSDLPSTINNPIVETLLSGLLVTVTILFAAWVQNLMEKWSRSSKRRKLIRIREDLGHVTALSQDPEKLVLELSHALTTSLLFLSLSIIGGVLATVFLVMLAISFQLHLSGSTSPFPDLLSRLSPTHVAITGGLITLFVGVSLSFGIKACLGALKLINNVKDFQVYQEKVDKEITKLNLSIKRG
jgi:hypothetical protein